MIWGYTAKGVGKISIIDGKMNAQRYKQILPESFMSLMPENLMSSVESLELPSDYIFQQDNDPKHIAKSTKKLSSENNINVLQWPSQSSDFNTSENLWRFLKIHIQKEYQQTPIF